MPKNKSLTQQDFDALLNWFSPNRDEAGAVYEEIRNGLIRYFHFKGCAEVENLADETINRVAGKFSSLKTDNNFKQITYFYGFASKIYLEYRNSAKNVVVEFEPNLHSGSVNPQNFEDEKETLDRCLEHCLGKLSPEERMLAVQYFSKEKSEKFEHRRQLAEKMNLNMGTLHVRIYRLKDFLRKCINNCLNEK